MWKPAGLGVGVSWLVRWVLLLLLAMLSACSAGGGAEDGTSSDDLALSPLPPETNDPIAQTPWETLGAGVSYKSLAALAADAGQQANVLVVYGGYTAQDVYVQRWADELVRVKGTALGITHLYAVRGPDDPGYANDEIENSKLVAHLASDGRAATAATIIVIAHSSGTYVADEFFRMLRAGRGGVSPSTIGKVALFNLDGGGVNDATTLQLMARAYFVFACDAVIDRCSHNADSMRTLGNEYAALGGAVAVVADGSQCSKKLAGGLWCLHDTLINTLPHNSANYDLRDDYTDFASPRHLVTSYLDQPL
jgi:hypothetical protein